MIRWILILFFATVRAEELQFDLTGTAYTPENPYSPGVGPFDISFLLDTQSGTTHFTYGNFRTPGGVSCLQHFDVSGALISDVNMTLNGQRMFSGDSALTNYGGDNAGGGCPGFFFAALLFNTPRVQGWWEFDPTPGPFDLSKSSDPISTLFLGFQQYPSVASIVFDGSPYNLGFKSVSVTSVPEPGAFALFLLGLTGIVISRWSGVDMKKPAKSKLDRMLDKQTAYGLKLSLMVEHIAKLVSHVERLVKEKEILLKEKAVTEHTMERWLSDKLKYPLE